MPEKKKPETSALEYVNSNVADHQHDASVDPALITLVENSVSSAPELQQITGILQY